MNRERFQTACQTILNAERARDGIGTLGEKTLHAVLKHYYAPDPANHEIRVGSFVADIVTESGIIEIQTRSFEKLTKKLTAFLANALVTLVYPLPKTKWLLWVDEQTGDITKKRKSPRQGNIADAIYELYKIKQLLQHPNLKLCIPFIDVEEYRYLNGWSEDKKRGSTRCDRIPVALAEEIHLETPADYAQFLPEKLPSRFTTKDYKTAARTNQPTAQRALHLLYQMGVAARVGKRGKSYLYECIIS
ncbi:MAG: hypothetical protein FWF10_07880 [Clostridiales bacterium]|nr:hypothetical protein [Clostridiales bacterium]